MSPARTDPLIEALLGPDPYPHATEEIQLAETHISWVLLTGAYAYMVKKPLKLPFLDFSTLELRRHFCEEELRVNRRLAPELYLDVVPLGGSREKPRVGSEPAVEYAVKMKQFPADATVDRQLGRNAVSGAAIIALAELVARFHIELPADTEGAGEEAARVAAAALDNFEPLQQRLRDPEQQRMLSGVRAWTEEQCRRLAATFERRRAGGRVREGHGDLHLENLVDLDGRIVPFDALEFDRSLRLVDVVSEAAFLMMDLMGHSRDDLAFAFVNRYLEVSGDYPGLDVLRFYLVYRALVRAKVRAIKASQDTTLHSAEHGPRPYLRLARTLTESAAPVLAITHGLSGSGKTTHTQGLLQELPAIRVRSDLERKRIHGLDATGRSESAPGAGLYDAEATARTYRTLQEHAARIVQAGFHVIIDAAFLSGERRRQFRRLAQDVGARFRILDCQADQDTLRARVRMRAQRGDDASEAGETVLAYQLRQHEPLTPTERADAVTIDTAAGVDHRSLARALLAEA